MNRFEPIANALARDGWSLSSLELASDCWWAREIWQLNSKWSPKGRIAYLTLLIDATAEFDKNRPPESAVWAAAVTNELPTSFADANASAISIKKRMNRAIIEIVQLAGQVRMRN